MDSLINQVERSRVRDTERSNFFSEFTEIKCSNNETVEQNITIQQNISSVSNQIKKETQVMAESKAGFQTDAVKAPFDWPKTGAQSHHFETP